MAVVSGGWRCTVCDFAQPRPIARLRATTLAFYDDARFPGRAVLVLGEHAELVEDLPLDVARDLALDVRQAAAAVRAASGARRINYAAFGNVVPHVHVHLIPRHGDWETAPRATPWDHPEPERPLPPGAADRLVAAIRAALD
ncbi:MAG: HIT family protein [Myxococcota bacterium]|nr:HIT family protein [Myxococcota bacterium]